MIFFPLSGDNSNDSFIHLPNLILSSADTIPSAIAFNDKKNPLYIGSLANPITWSMNNVKFSYAPSAAGFCSRSLYSLMI